MEKEQHSFQLKGVLRRNFNVSIKSLQETLAVYGCSFDGTITVIDDLSVYLNGTISGDVSDCKLFMQNLLIHQYRLEKL